MKSTKNLTGLLEYWGTLVVVSRPVKIFGERVPMSHSDRRPWVTLVVARSQGRWTRSQLRP